MAGRVTQKPVEVVYTPSDRRARVTQKPVEVVYAPSDRRARVTQRAVEVIYKEQTPLVAAQILWID